MRVLSYSAVLAGVAVLLMGTPAQAGHVRTYFVAAHEVQWSYAPSGRNLITGQALRPAPADTVGTTYTKAAFDAYTDGTFSKRVSKPAYFGFLGPVIRAEVGDTIVIHFRNNTAFPASMHPHGVLYDKASEGAPYRDGTPPSKKAGAEVAPGHEFRYVWHVPERAGPAAMDPSSVMWMYHSHVNETKDLSSGLIGPLIITRKGMARADGSPKDVTDEIFMLFAVEDENQSNYMPANMKRIKDASKLTPADTQNPVGAWYATNELTSINGFIFGNLPMPVLHLGKRARWYLQANASDALDYHAIHWHGNVAVANGMRTDVVPVLAGSMAIADMVPDNAGQWLFHCHVGYHLDGGMVGQYVVR